MEFSGEGCEREAAFGIDFKAGGFEVNWLESREMLSGKQLKMFPTGRQRIAGIVLTGFWQQTVQLGTFALILGINPPNFWFLALPAEQ